MVDGINHHHLPDPEPEIRTEPCLWRKVLHKKVPSRDCFITTHNSKPWAMKDDEVLELDVTVCYPCLLSCGFWNP